MAAPTLLRSIVKDLSKELSKRESEVEVAVMGDGLFKAQPREWIPTGVNLLDALLGGGIPMGKLVEIFGEEQTGKSLLILSILAQAQKAGAFTGFLDAEQASTIEFAKQMGHIDVDNLLLVDAETLELGTEATRTIIDKVRERDDKIPIVLGIDSIAGFQTTAERDGLIEESARPAEAARIIRRWLRTITRRLAHERACVIFTNHETARIDQFGQKWTTYGGTGGRFGASLRIRLQTISRLKEQDRNIGVRVKVILYKTRFSAPWGELELPLFFGRGFDDVSTTIDYLYAKHELGSKTGYVIWEEKSLRKKDFTQKAREDPVLYEKLKLRALQIFKGETPEQDDPEVVKGA